MYKALHFVGSCRITPKKAVARAFLVPVWDPLTIHGAGLLQNLTAPTFRPPGLDVQVAKAGTSIATHGAKLVTVPFAVAREASGQVVIPIQCDVARSN